MKIYYFTHAVWISVPEVNWQVAELTLSEGEMIKVCFSIGIAAQTYEIEIDGHGKGNQTAGNFMPDI